MRFFSKFKPWGVKGIILAVIGGVVIAAAIALIILCSLFRATTDHRPSRVFKDSKSGKTVIELTVEAWSWDKKIHADFVKNFPDVFKKKYAPIYKANPAKYGKFNWDNVEVRLKFFPGVKYYIVSGGKINASFYGSPLWEKLLALATGGKLVKRNNDGLDWRIAYRAMPDVIQSRNITPYLKEDILYPLDQYISGLADAEREKLFSDSVPSQILPLIYRKKKNDLSERYWALPAGGGAFGQAVVYNKKFLVQHNIPLPTENWTWEDMLAVSRKIMMKTRYSGFAMNSNISDFSAFIRAAGGKSIGEDPVTGKLYWDVNADILNKTITFYYNLFEQPGARFRLEPGSYRGNQLCIIWIDHWDDLRYAPQGMSIMPLPFGPPDSNGVRHRGAALQALLYGISAFTLNPVIRDAAWEYILHSNSDAAHRIRTTCMVKMKQTELVNPKYLKRFGFDKELEALPENHSRIFDIIMESSVPEPVGSNDFFCVISTLLRFAHNYNEEKFNKHSAESFLWDVQERIKLINNSRP